MASGKPMTAEVKARLKAAGLAKKGRASLKGLDPYGWAAAKDALDEDRVEFPAPSLIGAAGQITADFFDTRKFRWTFSRVEREADRSDRRGRTRTITHVAVRYARPDQLDDLYTWFGGVPVVEESFAGPVAGNVLKAFWLYPVAPVLKLFHAVWPGANDDWRGKAAKYLHGYTAGAVARRSPLGTTAVADKSWSPSTPSGFMDAVANNAHRLACEVLHANGLLTAVVTAAVPRAKA